MSATLGSWEGKLEMHKNKTRSFQTLTNNCYAASFAKGFESFFFIIILTPGLFVENVLKMQIFHPKCDNKYIQTDSKVVFIPHSTSTHQRQ